MSPSVQLVETQPEVVSRISPKDISDPHAEVKEIIRDFFKRHGFKPPTTYKANAELRSFVWDEVEMWDTHGDNQELFDGMVDTGFMMAQTSYAHTDLELQRYVALYTAVFTYTDELGGRDIEAMKQFASRLAARQKQLTPAMETLAELLGRTHELYPPAGTDAIISGTIDAVTAVFIECTMPDVKTSVSPVATLWPTYFRVKSGIAPPYANFIFPKSWRSSTESYMQMLPFMERWICLGNDVMSFYKEERKGERNNYMHIRAAVDQTTPTEVARKCIEEATEIAEKIDAFCANDAELADAWHSFQQGYMKFHFTNPRYRLSDLGGLGPSSSL